MSENRKFNRSASLQRCAVVSPTQGLSCPARIINQSPDGLLLELDCELAVNDVPVNIYLADEIRGTIDYESSNLLTPFPLDESRAASRAGVAFARQAAPFSSAIPAPC